MLRKVFPTIVPLFVFITILAFGEETFIAIPLQEAPQYHVNLARIFFATLEAEKVDRANLFAEIQNLETLKGKIGNSAKDLLHALQLYDQVQILFLKHYNYLNLRYSINTKDEQSLEESSSLEAEVNKRTAFVQEEILKIEDPKLDTFVVKQPALKPYLFALQSIHRYKSHTLPLKEEELLLSTAPLNEDWQFDLYGKLIARTNFGTVRTEEGEWNVWKQRANIAASSEPIAREEGFKKRYSGFASQQDLYAFTILHLAQARNRVARLRHYEDAADSAYFERYWTKAEVNDLLERVAQQAGIYKRYQKLRAEHIRKFSGLKTINVWDLSVQPEGLQTPRFTIDQASRIIRDSLAPLGPVYGKELAALLDPANGRMDIVPGDNRKSGGFSRGFIGTESIFYSAGFNGTYNDLRILTHESTHAIHRQLMNQNKVLAPYATGPNYLFESFAIFSEFLLPDYLYNHQTDPQLKQYFLEQFLDGKGMIPFVAGPEAILEQAIYDGVEKDSIHGADELDALTLATFSRFSIWPEKQSELKHQWMMIPLMYEDPFYDVNYVYGGLLALKYYELYTRDPEHFIPQYIALLSNGFDAPPATLLKKFLNIDLNDPNLVSDAVNIIEKRVSLLEESYADQR